MLTKSERFIRDRRVQWAHLREILLKLRRQAGPRLTSAEVRDFARLYRLACADLAEARTLKLAPDVIEYLNNLVGQAHKYLYSFKPLHRSQVVEFFTEHLPAAVIKNRHFISMAAILFFVPYIITFLMCRADPDIASQVVSEHLLDMMAESYKKGMFTGRGAGAVSAGVAFYIQHNITIAFLSFATGIFAGLGSIYFLVYNGITLGAITGYIVGMGYGKNLGIFVTAHSVMEFSGLLAAGAAGLVMGYTLVKATRLFKKDQLALKKHHIFHLLCAAGLMLACAAAIEGGISPQPLPYIFKAAVALGSAALLWFYFGLLPRRKKRQPEKAADIGTIGKKEKQA